MDQPETNVVPENETPEKNVSRRQLLKALAATGGAVSASSLLPGKWVKPVVDVGLLPAHAQVTPPREPPVYLVSCDSTPEGGDLGLTQGNIRDIQPRLQLLSGTGPVEGIAARMTVITLVGPTPTFDPPLPQTTTTNAGGLALFPDLQVTNPTFGQEFRLRFEFDVPGGLLTWNCGVFFFGEFDF